MLRTLLGAESLFLLIFIYYNKLSIMLMFIYKIYVQEKYPFIKYYRDGSL